MVKKETAPDADLGEMGPDPRNRLNDLTGKEWIQETKSFWFQKGLGSQHPEAQFERLHPAPFSFTDIARLIRFFTKSGETVLDPFAGVGSTLKACHVTGRRGIGIELVGAWADLAQERIRRECGRTGRQHKIVVGDALEELPKLKSNSVQFVVTSPPYWGILNKRPDYKTIQRVSEGLAARYSELATDGEAQADLANVADYETFLKRLGDAFEESLRVLAHKRYLAVVVGDFRHKDEFVPFHADLVNTIRGLGKRRAVLKGIKILAQNHKQLFPYGYPYEYVPNVHHQYILIFRKESDVGD